MSGQVGDDTLTRGGFPKELGVTCLLARGIGRFETKPKRKASTREHLIHWRITFSSLCYEYDTQGTTILLSICFITEGGIMHALSKKIDRIYPEGYTTLPQCSGA